jgi:hypothetical protein
MNFLNYEVNQKQKNMLKKVLIGFGILVLVIIIAFVYLNYRNRSLSPPGLATYEKNGFKMEIPYSKPSKKGRLIFGTAEEEALLPYGVYWRLGANEATEVSFNQDVFFNGAEIPAGTYRIYAIPGEQAFEISLNTQLGKWGAFEPDYAQDVLKTKVPVVRTDESVEQFNIRFEESGDDILIVCEWSDVKIKIPVRPK